MEYFRKLEYIHKMIWIVCHRDLKSDVIDIDMMSCGY